MKTAFHCILALKINMNLDILIFHINRNVSIQKCQIKLDDFTDYGTPSLGFCIYGNYDKDSNKLVITKIEENCLKLTKDCQ